MSWGETLTEAIDNANKCGFDLVMSEINPVILGRSYAEGTIVWTDRPVEGYNE